LAIIDSYFRVITERHTESYIQYHVMPSSAMMITHANMQIGEKLVRWYLCRCRNPLICHLEQACVRW